MPPTIDLPTQIGAFLVSRRGVAPADALYVIFTGGNDIRDARDVAEKQVAKAINREAVEGAAGAERILVANAPGIGAIPETRAPRTRTLTDQSIRLRLDSEIP